MYQATAAAMSVTAIATCSMRSSGRRRRGIRHRALLVAGVAHRRFVAAAVQAVRLFLRTIVNPRRTLTDDRRQRCSSPPWLPRHAAPPTTNAVPLFDDLGSYHRAISTKKRGRAAVLRSGPAPRLRLQSRRGRARLSRGGSARSRSARSAAGAIGLTLGPNINLPIDPERNAKAVEALAKAKSMKRRKPRRARTDRCARRALLRRPGRRPGEARRGLRQRDAGRLQAVPGGRRRRDALRRVDDGPAPVEVLERRRHAGPRDAKKSSRRSKVS